MVALSYGTVMFILTLFDNISDSLNKKYIEFDLVTTSAEEEPKSSGFVPETFDEYIGQEKAKSLILSYISGVKKLGRILPHTLIYGSAGTGKTTLARIISIYLDVECREIIASTLDNITSFVDMVRQVNGGVIILDEVHALDRTFVEQMYTIMTDFSFNGEALTPFTLMGCTTEYGEMVEKCLPFVERFKIDIELEKYSHTDIVEIIKQFKKYEFPDTQIPEEVYSVIADNAKNTPRRGIKYLTSTIYLGNDVRKMLHNFNIIKKGYTKSDLQILKYLSEANVAGLQAICSYLGTSVKNYQQLESYLLQSGLILRTARGRKISEEGLSLLKELEMEVKMNEAITRRV